MQVEKIERKKSARDDSGKAGMGVYKIQYTPSAQAPISRKKGVIYIKLLLQEDTSVCKILEEDYYDRQILITVTVFSTTEASQTIERRGTLQIEGHNITLDTAAERIAQDLLLNLPAKKRISTKRSDKHD